MRALLRSMVRSLHHVSSTLQACQSVHLARSMMSAGCSQKCYFGFLSDNLKPHHGYLILIVAHREGQPY